MREGRRCREKCRRYLLGRQPADLAQCHRDLRIGIQGGVTAGENQPQAVVCDIVVLDLAQLERHIRPVSHFAARLAQPVDRLEPAGGDEPGARIGGRAFDRPALDRRGECVLKRLLGEVKVAEETNQGGENATGFGAVERLDRVYGWSNSITGRTSTMPCLAPGIRDAT